MIRHLCRQKEKPLTCTRRAFMIEINSKSQETY